MRFLKLWERNDHPFSGFSWRTSSYLRSVPSQLDMTGKRLRTSCPGERGVTVWFDGSRFARIVADISEITQSSG